AEALTLVDTDAAGERADLLRGVVRMVEDLGHETIVHVDTGAVPAAHATTRLDLPEPDRGLTELFADQPETVGGLRQALSWIRPRHRPRPPAPTARTEFGFYPVYDPEQSRTPRGDLVLRIACPAPAPRRGEAVAMSLDLDRV